MPRDDSYGVVLKGLTVLVLGPRFLGTNDFELVWGNFSDLFTGRVDPFPRVGPGQGEPTPTREI